MRLGAPVRLYARSQHDLVTASLAARWRTGCGCQVVLALPVRPGALLDAVPQRVATACRATSAAGTLGCTAPRAREGRWPLTHLSATDSRIEGDSRERAQPVATWCVVEMIKPCTTDMRIPPGTCHCTVSCQKKRPELNQRWCLAADPQRRGPPGRREDQQPAPALHVAE